MKKRIFVVIILIMIFITITVILSINNKSDDIKQGSEMAIMVQNESNNTQYDKWESETWPDESQYQLNTTKSKCNNTENVTDILSYSNNNVSINTNKTYRCNLFFDKKKDEPLEITSVDVDTSEYYTAKLTVHAKGGSGKYTYSVESTSCTQCDGAQSQCGLSSNKGDIKIEKNIITISELKATSNPNSNYKHTFIIKVSDGKSEARYTVSDVNAKREPCSLGQACDENGCSVEVEI